MGIHEIRIFDEQDPLAETIRAQAASMLGVDIDVATARVFRAEGISQEEAQTLAEEALSDPLTTSTTLGPRTNWHNPDIVEIAPQPGMMNPEEEPLRYAASLLDIAPVAVSSSTELHFAEHTPPEDRDRVISRIAMNKTVERIMTGPPETLQISGEVGPIETIPVRNLTEAPLAELSKARSLFLDPTELTTLQNYFQTKDRDPTDAELEAIAGRWSEHCGHKTFNAKIFKDGIEKEPLFDRIKNTSRKFFNKEIVSAFHDNAGVFMFFEGMCINIKLETHNSPSAVEPRGGAMTGVGGVLRDGIGTGQGAKVILSVDILCFADPKTPDEQVPEGCLSPAYIQERVLTGIRDYGNRMGVPTANGSLHYHPNFRAKPTVMVGSLGFQPEQFAHKGIPEHGDLVVAMGGRTGRDGIHGATFSSGDMTAETSAVHSSAVQIGDAIQEKKFADALLEARDALCIRALTDCGAAGFSSAIGEMGEDIGVQVDLADAPLKYTGLAPWEIWMSESQERMVAAVIPEKYEEFAAICAKHGVEAAALGTFGSPPGQEPSLRVFYEDQPVINLDYDFLKNGLAQRELVANWQHPEIAEAKVEVTDWQDTIHAILSHGNIASKEDVVRGYDHEVQAGVVVKPYGGVHRDAPNDAVVIEPMLGKPYGVVFAHGMNPVLNDIDPYWGSVWAVAEGMSNYAAVGGNPQKAVLTNNYVTATPDEHVMGALDMMVDAVCDSMHALRRPVISGKDSLSSRYKRTDESGEVIEVIDVPPVLTIAVAGKIANTEKTVTSDIKAPGSTLVLVGQVDHEALGGSIFYETHGGSSAAIPRVDLQQLPRTLRGIFDAIQTDEVLACHDVSEGGVLTAVSEMAFGGDCGVELHLSATRTAEQQLLNETAGCFVVEVDSPLVAQRLFGHLPYQIIGQTVLDKRLTAFIEDAEQLFNLPIPELKQAWKRQMPQKEVTT